ncbi:hypothetical protein BFP72_05620 [Reichenbachiella sp. 5M10]|uniref:hypothetical protein n=1 Tax=Reichenbachiella sp. 5M10 TaxID=1889772 RepID=UPI000C149CD5|nr:hypothetical protein [Reichenbachiella sp. 5M10]PIB34909.1 hypothetical protein BFP72_05620 [Reichenbachiella sp. 5M10]
MKKLILLGLMALALYSCAPQEQTPLDIAEYLSLADSAAIHPNAQQLDRLKGLVPEEAFQPAPDYTDRGYWKDFAKTDLGQYYLSQAAELIDKKPEVPISDEIYRRANREGNRGIYKPRYYRTMDRLEKYILAECMENQGRYLDPIVEHTQAILAMKSWLHPNHDDKDNTVLEGKRVSIDLGARKFALVLALADAVLTDQLPATLRQEIGTQLQWRITDSYLQSTKELEPESNKWIRSTSNWNSVCTSGTLFGIMVTSDSQEERLQAIGSAINSMRYYMSGFGDDGYCSEGTGYWSYGFGHYLYLAEILYDYTDGKIDLFTFDNPQKLRKVANFPETYQIHPGLYAPFSDGVTRVKSEHNFAYVMAAKYYGSQKPSYFQPDEAVQSIVLGADYQNYISDQAAEVSLPDHTYFDDYGIIISRGQQEQPLSIAIKAGHNAENHNHSDVGSYVIALGDQLPAGDIGAPSYTAGAFAPTNPARSSWGHPVPRIDGQLQSNGIEYAGQITMTEFGDQVDRAEMNLLPAYEVEGLQQLTRRMSNDKSGQGEIEIADSFVASRPLTFGTAIMTLGEYQIIDDSTVILTENGARLKAVVTAVGGEFNLSGEQVPVEHLREGAPAYRIGVDMVEPLTRGEFIVKYSPLSNID